MIQKNDIEFVKIKDEYGIKRYLVQTYDHENKSWYNRGCIWPHNNPNDQKTGWHLDEKIMAFCGIDPEDPESPHTERIVFKQANEQCGKHFLRKKDKTNGYSKYQTQPGYLGQNPGRKGNLRPDSRIPRDF